MPIIGVSRLEDMIIRSKEYSTIGGSEVIDFLKGLEKPSQASKIYVILDNGRADKTQTDSRIFNDFTYRASLFTPIFSKFKCNRKALESDERDGYL